MMVIERAQVPDALVPTDALATHLRLGTGFSGDDLQQPVLASFLRAAMAAIEARTDKALIRRDFVLTVDAWKRAEAQPLPVAPVVSLTSLVLRNREGAETPVDLARVKLAHDATEPVVLARSGCLPVIPERGEAVLRFVAGYGDTFSDLPPDLQQAVLLLAAHYYEYRDDTALTEGCMPFGVTSLIARYRKIRMGFSA